MKTVWIINDEPWAAEFSNSSFINYKTDKLAKFKGDKMKVDELEKIINSAFEDRMNISETSDQKI